MVAKITVGNNLYSALSYNQEKVDAGLGKVLGSNIVREPVDGVFHVSAVAEEFQQWMPTHYRTEKPVIHISLNPHPEDKLTDEQLGDIAREYLGRLGYGEQPFVIFKHEDIEREHIHIVSLQVKSDGKKINDSKIGERSKAITEELEQKYGLHPAEGEKRTEQWQLSPLDAEKGNLKKQISSVVKPAAAMYHFQTMGEYKALLSLYNIGLEEVRGEKRGEQYRGLLYYALNPDGNKISSPLKSSLFGKGVGYDGLEKRMEKSKEHIKEHGFSGDACIRVVEAMKDTSNEDEFSEKLREKGIDLFLRRNDTGRITGVTFIDHNNRCVLNGSRLGKEFSANVFNEWFAELPVDQENINQISTGNHKEQYIIKLREEYDNKHPIHKKKHKYGRKI